MTILHGDARFYNNIFVQQDIREDLLEYTRAVGCDAMNCSPFVCGTKPYDGYPTAEAYFAQFQAGPKKRGFRDAYYSHLPVYTGGNVYFNGAQPCDTEENYRADAESRVSLSLEEREGKWFLHTNLYEYLPSFELQMIHTELLGEAFEPEQKFEAPDGSPILFDLDYFGRKRETAPIAGPFACSCEAKEAMA